MQLLSLGPTRRGYYYTLPHKVKELENKTMLSTITQLRSDLDSTFLMSVGDLEYKDPN